MTARPALSGLLLALLTGCSSTAPAVFTSDAPPDALACALSEATAAGYSVQAAEDGVFFNAEKARQGTRDGLNVTVSRGTLRVIATTVAESGEGRAAAPPSKGVRHDGDRITSLCGGSR